MNEKEMMEFIQFCAQVVPEFKGKSPEEISQALSAISESNPETLQQLFAEFQKAKKAFKRGGKIEQFVNRFKKGGKAAKKCACGCELVKVAEKGGIVEKCACGCKNVVKAQEGEKVGLNLSNYKLKNSKINNADTTMTFSRPDESLTITATPEGRRIDQYKTFGAGNMFRSTYTNTPSIMDRIRSFISPMNNKVQPMTRDLNNQVTNVFNKNLPKKN